MDSKEQRDEAEGDLLDLIRRNDAQNFLVTIICMEHRWRVEVIDHDAKQTEPRSDRSIPTLIVHREGDVRVNVEAGRFLAHQIPNAQYVELPGKMITCCGPATRNG